MEEVENRDIYTACPPMVIPLTGPLLLPHVLQGPVVNPCPVPLTGVSGDSFCFVQFLDRAPDPCSAVEGLERFPVVGLVDGDVLQDLGDFLQRHKELGDGDQNQQAGLSGERVECELLVSPALRGEALSASARVGRVIHGDGRCAIFGSHDERIMVVVG